MQPQYDNKVLRNLEAISKTTARIDARLEPRVGIKTILETTARVFLNDHEREDDGIRINGRVITRVVFIDEMGTFNSDERTNNFSERIILSNAANLTDILPSAHVQDVRVTEGGTNSVDAQVNIEITLLGLSSREVRYVTGVTGEVESRMQSTRITSWGGAISSRFEIEERIDLDKSCEGILGVDVVPVLRDLVTGEGRVTLKGVAGINILATKRGDEQCVYNDNVEFDFSKTIQHKTLGIDDSVVGTVTVANVEVRAETKESPQLVVTTTLEFRGFSIVSQELSTLGDAYGFAHHLDLKLSDIDCVTTLPAHHTNIEVDGNLNMGEKSPFITKILSVGTASITSLNVTAQNDRATIEGALSSNITYECEEKQIHAHVVKVPFSTQIKMDGITATHNISAKVDVTQCRVRARRGRELLVDARLGVALSAHTQTTVQIVTDVTLGEAKPTDDSAILIYTVGDGETTWDIAKRLNCRASEILAQNQIDGDPRPGDKIFIYRQLTVNF